MKKKSIKVEVTHEDIMDGIKCSSNGCPIAHALTRACEKFSGLTSEGLYGIRVFPDYIILENLHEYRHVMIPDEMTEWVNTFDKSKEEEETVEPFEFVIQPCDKTKASYKWEAVVTIIITTNH